MRKPATSAIIVALLLTTTATTTACSSKSTTNAAAGTSAGGSTAGSSPAAAAAAPAGGSVDDGLGHPVDVCSLLPVADVARISGEPLTVAKEDDTVSYKIYGCSYTSTDGTSGVDVSVLALDAAAGYDGGLQAAGSGAKQISGVGDKAYSAITGVQALFGNVSITVSNLQSDDAAVQIIKELQPKL